MVRPSSVRNRNVDRARVRATATANATSRFTSTNTGPSQSVAVASDDVTRVGSGPNTISATFSSTSATPSIRRICISWGASTIRSTSPRWIRRPSTNSAAAQRANPAYGSTPACVASRYARYMPQTIMSPWAKFTTRITPKIRVRPTAIRLYTPPKRTPLTIPCRTSVRSTPTPTQGRKGGSSGAGAVPGGVVETRSRNAATGAPRPDGAQPPRVCERVRRGRATPPGTAPAPLDPPSPLSVVLSLGPREDEFLQRGLAGPDGDGLLAQDLDHRRDRVGVVAELVEDDRAAVLHEAAGVVRLLHRVGDRVGIDEARGALEDVGDDEHGVVGIARVRVERLSARASPELLADRGGLRVLEVRPRHARQHVLEVLLELGQLARLVEAGTAGADDAHRLDPLLRDLGKQQQRGGRARDRRDHVGLGRLRPRHLGGKVGRRLRPRNDLDDLPRRVGRLVGRLEATRLVLSEEVVAVHQHDPLRRHVGFLEDLDEVLHGLAAEARARREVAVDVLHLLLAVPDRLGDVGRDRIGRGDVDEERDALLLGDRHHCARGSRVERPQQHLGALVDDALGLDATVLGLGLRVADDQLELDPALRLDASGRVDRTDRHLSAESASLPRLGERARHRMNGADLERLRLRAERERKSHDGGATGSRLEKRATGQSVRRHHEPPRSGRRITNERVARSGPSPRNSAAAREPQPPRSSLAMIMRWIWFVPS